jgi:GxxExxY protein
MCSVKQTKEEVAEYLDENEISKLIIGCAMKVHSRLGPGLLESAYEACLAYELSQAGLRFERQKPMPLIYEEVKLDVGYRLDLIVEGKVVVDPKSVGGFDAHIHGANANLLEVEWL